MCPGKWSRRSYTVWISSFMKTVARTVVLRTLSSRLTSVIIQKALVPVRPQKYKRKLDEVFQRGTIEHCIWCQADDSAVNVGGWLTAHCRWTTQRAHCYWSRDQVECLIDSSERVISRVVDRDEPIDLLAVTDWKQTLSFYHLSGKQVQLLLFCVE